ncbi:glutathione S-transferase family protein [Endozoicomonas arenosclerae]|uniref:glutathione S-transferase family protein n=1 Tax=Endozoicomonas arenosclerae TaxID=1633495 RepID=UPI000782AD4A|nr:glutathione S-transferase family protein [Endozoicomonas arenosclerae]
MIKLYGFGQSRSFRALWALEESGVDFEYTNIRIGSSDEGGSQHPSYLKINAQGKVPTLVDGDLVLTESAAILNYIGSLIPEKQLVPNQTPAARAKYDDFCFFVLSDLEQPLWSKGKHSFVLPEEHRIEAMFETVKFELSRSMKALDHYMEGKEFVLGDQFSCADILLAQTLNWADRFEFDVPKQYLEYRDRLYQRPACQRAIAKTKSK